VFANILSDEQWLAQHLEKAYLVVKKHSDLLQRTLRKIGVPFVRPRAALFLWADFTEPFGKKIGGPQKLFELLMDKYKIMLTPGHAFYDSFPPKCSPTGDGPGSKSESWMRICFAAVNTEAFVYGLSQLEKFATDFRMEKNQNAISGSFSFEAPTEAGSGMLSPKCRKT